MKKTLVVVALAALTLVGNIANVKALAAQDQPEPAPKKSNRPSQKVTLSGKLNDSGDIFIADKDLKSWKVTNPRSEAVKNHRSEDVTISAIQDFRHGTVTVQSAKSRNERFSSAPATP
jgi:hypothetical protein